METQRKRQKAIFAGGCFWNVEAAFRKLSGITKTVVGYTGGHLTDPSYEQVCSGSTGHAEAVEIEFNSTAISCSDLLEKFWQLHDPTQINQQGPDVGAQYRSAIFYLTNEQKVAAEASKQKLIKDKTFKEPIATEITKAGPFYEAEDYHQQYLEKRGLAICTPQLKEVKT